MFNFNVGDKVAYSARIFGGTINEVDEIVKITPTGRIRLKKNKDEQFDKHGWQIGNHTYRAHIEPLTPDLHEQIIKTNTIQKACKLCSKVNNKDLDYETAKKLVEILDKKGEE